MKKAARAFHRLALDAGWMLCQPGMGRWPYSTRYLIAERSEAVP